MASRKTGRSSIAQAIREARLDLRLDQGQLADRIHVTPATVSRWECDHVTPPLEQRRSIVNCLRDAPPDLLARLARGLELALPPSAQAKTEIRREPAVAQRAAVTALREAADDLDMTAQAVRLVLARVGHRLEAAQVTWDELLETVKATLVETSGKRTSPASRPKLGRGRGAAD